MNKLDAIEAAVKMSYRGVRAVEPGHPARPRCILEVVPIMVTGDTWDECVDKLRAIAAEQPELGL